MGRVVHFGIHAERPERAAEFYTALFGWQITKWEGPFDYWVVTTGPEGSPGINGGIVARRSPLTGSEAVMAYVCTVDVENLDDSVASALRLGAAEALPKMPVPGIGWLAYMKDSEGNLFGMMQSDPSAA